MNNYGDGTVVGGTTTSTTTVTETHVQTNLRWDPSYIKTIPGMLKVAAVVLDMIVFICVASSSSYYRETTTAQWFYFVSMTGFFVTGILLVFYLLHVIEKFHVIPWMMIELGFCILWAFFYFTASIDCAVNASNNPPFGAAAFFGFVTLLVYGYDGFIKFQGWRAGQLAQGERTVQQSQSSSTAQATY